jgi:hypothetical protein
VPVSVLGSLRILLHLPAYFRNRLQAAGPQ